MASATTRRSRWVTIVTLIVAAMVAVGGITWRVGRAQTPPASSLGAELALFGESLRCTLVVKTNVENAQITVDGAPVAAAVATEVDVLGPHVVSVRAPGYRDYRDLITVQPARPRELVVTLERPEAAAVERPARSTPLHNRAPTAAKTDRPTVHRDDAVDPFAP